MKSIGEIVLVFLLLFTCALAEQEKVILDDGEYAALFETDSSMFKVNETYNDRGILTVKDGNMTIHISLASKNILKLYAGLAANAEENTADHLEPTIDPVTYSDGWTEDVYGFDIPVPAIDEDFSIAIIGKKGKWYDHTVRVTDPIPVEQWNLGK